MAISLEKYIQDNYAPSFNNETSPVKFNKKKATKGNIVYPYNQISNKLYFLNSGIIETTVGIGDKEKTLSFIFEGTFFGAYSSLLTNSPSELQGTALTDCEYEELSYRDFVRISKYSLLANKIAKAELEKYYLIKLKREIAFLTKTTEEIYQSILMEQPEVIQQIPIKKIANYLGILPETLSRIRKRIIT